MTQASLISSGLSLDDENADSFITCIRVLLEQFFDQMKPFKNAGDPISALLSASEKQQTLFRERSTEILHASVESLLKYAIFQNISPISLKQSNIEMHLLSKQFIKLLSGIILIYPTNKLCIFFDKLLLALFNIIHENDFVLPNVIDKDITIKFKEYKENRTITIEIFLQLIIKIISQIPNDNKNLLEIAYRCLFNFSDQPTIQYLALRCLSRSYPYSISNSLIQIRLITNFMLDLNKPIDRNDPNKFTYLFNLSIISNWYQKSDKYATNALKNALSSLPKNILTLFGREILGYLCYLPRYKDFKITNEIFNIFKTYLEADHANCKQIGPLLLNLFKEFFRNEIFTVLCRTVSSYDELFKKKLIQTYIRRGNPEYIPFLLNINPHLLIEYNELLDSVYLNQRTNYNFFYENIPCPIFYQICAFLAKQKDPGLHGLTKEMIDYLEKSINKDEIPEPSLVSPLMRFIPKILMQHLPEYDLDTTYDAIFTNKTHLTDDIKNILINKAKSTKPFPLIPYFIIAYPPANDKENLQFDEFLKKAANPQLSNNPDDYTAYEHKMFIDALTKRFHDNIEEILPKDIILTLLRKKMFKSARFLGYNKKTFPLFFKQIFQIFKTDSGYYAQAAFFTLKDISKSILNNNINMNQFAFFGELFSIISTKDTYSKIVSIGIREEIVKSLLLYLISPPSLNCVTNDNSNIINYNNANENKSIGYLLQIFKDSIIPILVRNKDENSINEFADILYKPIYNNKQNNPNARDFFVDHDSDNFIKFRNNLIKSSLLETFTYLLSYCDRSVCLDSLMFLKNLTEIKPFDFVNSNHINLTKNLLLYLGHPKREIRNQTKLGISVIASALENIKTKEQNDVITRFWQNNLFNTIHNFSYILNQKSDFSKRMVLESLYNGLEPLTQILPKYYPKITSLIDLAIKDPDLTKKCLLFCSKFLTIVGNSDKTIEHLFGQIITQVLPYFEEYPDLVKKILKFLIIEKFDTTHSHFPEIAHIPIFYEQSDLKEISEVLTNEIQKINWKDQIKILIDQLEQASPTFRKQLLTQLLFFIKEYIDEMANDKSNSNYNSISQILIRSLWDNISHETNQELLSLSGRCMSLLPYIKEAGERKDENGSTKKNKVEIIISMINDYLIKVLEDSSNALFHDHAAYAIQELLKKLINEPLNDEKDVKPVITPSSSKMKIGNLTKIPENIWNIIEPFVTSKFSCNEIRPLDQSYEAIAPKTNNFNSWLSQWTSTMFSVSCSSRGDPSPDSEIFYCCDCVLGDSPGLTKFILPYLISFNSKNEFFLSALRKEWDSLHNILLDNKEQVNEQSKEKQNRDLSLILMAKNAMRLFFQLFDVLNKWRIVVGSVHHRGGKWISLNIATDETLAYAAFECELYFRALYHIEIHINENKKLKECLPFLYKIYQKIDDSDMKKVISKAKMDQNLNNSKSENDDLILDESFSANEIIYLAKQQDTNEKISYINRMLLSGRAERALIDATNLKSGVILENSRNAKLDAIISSAALRLTRWEELQKISYEYEIPLNQGNKKDFSFYLTSHKYSNVDVDSLIDISTGKLLYFLKSKRFNEFSNELNSLRSLLSLKLSAVSMMTSYNRLISLLAQFRVFEEVEDFYNQKYIIKDNNKKLCFGDWIKQTELSVDDVEFVTSVRCALISIESSANNENQDESTNDFSSQWLNLSRMCRKSESLFRAEMFCSRARYSTPNPGTCNFEFAKIAYAKNKKDQAISLIKSIQKQISRSIEPMKESSKPAAPSLSKNDKASELSELFGKILYTRAKWTEEMNSEDSSSIMSIYRQSVQLQEQVIKNENQNNPNKGKSTNQSEKLRNAILGAAKAFFSLGALADQRATSYIQYITETSEMNQKRSPRPGKFWNQLTPNEMKEFLLHMITGALENYLSCIIYAPQFSYEVVPRILFLFFDIGRYFIPDDEDKKGITNLSQNQKQAILAAMRESMTKVEKVKAGVWLNVITQLISRIDQPKALEDVLFKLIKMSVLEYPESSLWHLISIKHSNVVNRKPKWDPIMEYIKRDLQKDFAMKLEATTNNLASIAHHIIDLCSANAGASKSKVTKASHLCPKLVSDLKDCRVLMPLLSTLTVNLDSPSNQNSLNRIEIIEMGSRIFLFSSLQKPRKVEFKASNGISYHYLCKKDEDLRKDMRMMEFATFINRILNNDRRCRQKDLRIVTYAVICLNECCGMMEWVENTKSFRSIVTKMLGFKGITIDYNEVRKIYIEVDKPTQEQIQQKISNFKNILLKKFPPVLHAWFACHYKDISSWFKSRLLYTRSTALWSMVGYIIGLGDRHAENILLNTKTGSCVHVDFNLMFDRAKTLAVPEIVPFRLTQNIVDGMGAMGTDGPFTETSILVMETFRAKKLKLVSVLQTFSNDPLIEWRKGSKAATESTAKMTLKEVERRIAGTDESRSTTLSSECVVKELIKQATNIQNLVLMFIGWQSYI